MPRECEGCSVILPDAVRVEDADSGVPGTRGVKHCPFCGEEMLD